VFRIPHNRFFSLQPEAMIVLGFPATMDPNSEEVKKNKRFRAHAKYFVQLLDRALDMLGPADDVLTDILEELGRDHAKLGVKPTFFPALGMALIQVLEEELPVDDFNEKVKSAWLEIYSALSADMIKSITATNSGK
jgi:hemoglobin-like flavoprotein